jgi:hypothetical protein
LHSMRMAKQWPKSISVPSSTNRLTNSDAMDQQRVNGQSLPNLGVQRPVRREVLSTLSKEVRKWTYAKLEEPPMVNQHNAI